MSEAPKPEGSSSEAPRSELLTREEYEKNFNVQKGKPPMKGPSGRKTTITSAEIDLALVREPPSTPFVVRRLDLINWVSTYETRPNEIFRDSQTAVLYCDWAAAQLRQLGIFEMMETGVRDKDAKTKRYTVVEARKCRKGKQSLHDTLRGEFFGKFLEAFDDPNRREHIETIFGMHWDDIEVASSHEGD